MNYSFNDNRFDKKDIYFTPEYGMVYEKNNEGILKTFYFECEYGKVYYNFLLRDIKPLKNKKYYDIITPYGYGGPLFLDYDLEDLKKLILQFKDSFEKYCKDNCIVTEFIRFHPLIKNYNDMDLYMDISNIRNTIYMNLITPDKIWSEMFSSCRTSIKKARKNFIEIEIKLIENVSDLDEFIPLYYKTMERNNAKEYYFFNKEYFHNCFKLLKGNIYLCNAIYQDKIIASTLLFKYGEFIHSHLSALDYDYKELSSNNLLIYKTALWGYEQGCKYFHLGGGYLGNNDSLYRFKKNFSRKGISKYYIGKKIHNKMIYKELVEKWKEVNPNYQNQNLDYFPLYRLDMNE